MANEVSTAGADVANGPKGQPSSDDPKSPVQDMFETISNDVLPETDLQDGKQVAQDVPEPDKVDPAKVDPDVDADDDLDDDDGKPGDGLDQHSAADLRQMVLDSQKQIGTLANRLGEMTTALTNAVKKPDVPPQHVVLANSSPEEIEAHLKLPEGVTGVQVKLMASLLQSALTHELKRFEPMLNDFSEMKSDLSTQEQLLAKYSDLPQYAPRIKAILNKRYPTGIAVDKRGAEIESVYLKLKKREKAEELAKGQNALQRQQVKNGSGAKVNAGPQQKKSPDFFDGLNTGIE